jgi:hypothetical protein
VWISSDWPVYPLTDLVNSHRVIWYPDGTDGWSEAGLPLEDAQPIPRPNE